LKTVPKHKKLQNKYLFSK